MVLSKPATETVTIHGLAQDILTLFPRPTDRPIDHNAARPFQVTWGYNMNSPSGKRDCCATALLCLLLILCAVTISGLTSSMQLIYVEADLCHTRDTTLASNQEHMRNVSKYDLLCSREFVRVYAPYVPVGSITKKDNLFVFFVFLSVFFFLFLILNSFIFFAILFLHCFRITAVGSIHTEEKRSILLNFLNTVVICPYE